MPKKSITRHPYSYGSSDKAAVSSQFTPSPASSTLSHHSLLPKASPAPPRPRAVSITYPAHPRHSKSSSGFSGFTKCSFLPGWSSRISSTSFVSPLQARPVHQPFEPVLPDELAVRCGECITVLRFFDDGWCVVARDTSRSLIAPGMKNDGDNVDIGLVPAWVFAGPLEVISTTRPFRSTSLNALRTGHNPAIARDRVPSWANFA